MNAIWIGPAYCANVVWVLVSKNGRARYRETGEAIASARSNPDSLAGRAYRGRR